MKEQELGLFETMRSYNGNIIYFERHLTRLKKSAELFSLNIPYSSREIKLLVQEAVKKCGYKDSRLRITLWAGENNKTEFMISASRYQPLSPKKYKSGFSACISPLRQAEGLGLSNIKTSSRALFELSYRFAKNSNFDEAIILNNRGIVCEATRSNLFFIKDDELFTPSLKCGCLPGITRQAVFDLAKKYAIPVNKGEFTTEDLVKAEGAFLTNSLIGIMPLTKIGTKLINNRRIHHLTKFFIRQYNHLLKT